MNSLWILLEFFVNSLEIVWEFFEILWEFFRNSLRILCEFYRNSLGMCDWGVLNVWVLILDDKEVRFDFKMVDKYKDNH